MGSFGTHFREDIKVGPSQEPLQNDHAQPGVNTH